MSTFRYKALDTSGTTKRGLLESSSACHARQILRDRKLAPLEVAPAAVVVERITNVLAPQQKLAVDRKHIALCTLQLGTFLGAGVPLSYALKFIADGGPKQVSGLFHSIRNNVMEGDTLANAMSRYPEVFDTLYLASIEAGEQAGVLDKVLKSLADFQESNIENRRQIASALLYPTILLLASLSVVTLLVTTVMPGFIDIFEQNDQTLPPTTTVVLAAFNFAKSNATTLLLLLLIAIGLVRRAKESQAFMWKCDRALLHIPRINTFVANRTAENIARTLHILTASGMQLLDALKIATNIVSNRVMRKEMSQCQDLVEQGTSFSQALAEVTSMPAIMIQLAECGEATGELDSTLNKTAEILQRETQSTLSTIVSLVEPVILVLVSCLVLTIVIALMQPIFELNSFF
ncbi:MAG: type II secretion system F family protein [Halioglobus sp.]